MEGRNSGEGEVVSETSRGWFEDKAGWVWSKIWVLTDDVSRELAEKFKCSGSRAEDVGGSYVCCGRCEDADCSLVFKRPSYFYVATYPFITKELNLFAD